ncbi:MAG: flippase-like domain-containing protein [Pseudolabrys sp.]|nr:flippase-like domain-containing protein [Pseudolabrys sp.]
MKSWTVAALLAGIGLAVFLTVHFGLAQILLAVGRVGWGGFILICAAGMVVEMCLGVAWYLLMSPYRVPWHVLLFARQLRDSVSDILPFTHVGGMVVGVRAMMLGGAGVRIAFAGMVVDVTTELVGQVVFVLVGLAIGIGQLRANAATAAYASALIVGTLLLVVAAVALVMLQRHGTRLAERIAGRFFRAAVVHTKAFSLALDDFYRRPARILLSSAVHLVAWVASGLWIWLVLVLMGAPADMSSAIAIESLAGLLRSATAFVPASVGVQEAGYALLTPVFGMGPDVGLAVSLLKRARDLAVGIPVLLLWQAIEGRRAFSPLETS